MADGDIRAFNDARPAKLRLTRSNKRKLRAQAEAAVERLLSLLDDLDGDPDLEDGADLEQVCEDEGAQCDDEGFNSDDEPNADDTDSTWFVTPLAIDQRGIQWCYGDNGGAGTSFQVNTSPASVSSP